MNPANKRKKSSRLHGSHTHGWGAKKKHRGAGHRGGRGKSGTGKKAHQKMPSVWKDHPFGKKGFVSPTSVNRKVTAVNIEYLDLHINTWLASNQAKKEHGKISVDLTLLNIDKLLGKGQPQHSYKISVAAASENAVEKIKEKGGEVTLQ